MLIQSWSSHVQLLSVSQVRDQMRTAVGQARLLMKERFGQFSGLVDDCDFGRGEKITTCTDLQGFWDMVYFQVILFQKLSSPNDFFFFFFYYILSKKVNVIAFECVLLYKQPSNQLDLITLPPVLGRRCR